jgi:hypothetical protein
MRNPLKRCCLTLATVLLASMAAPSEAPALMDDGCMNGGPGATACSYTVVGGQGLGCSVSCSSGYACCTFKGCTCVQDS